MTNEEAIERINILKAFTGYDKDNQMVTELHEALDMAIKALEQQPSGDTLEKIRAEIVQMNEDVSKMLMPFDGLEKLTYTTGFIDGLGSALDIIDKYMAESEDQE